MLEEVLKNYNLKGELIDVKINSAGNIHNTYVVTLDDGKNQTKYLIQRINTVAFTHPKELMQNIEKVTKYLKNEFQKSNDFYHETMEIIKTKDNNNYSVIKHDEIEEYYRIYKYIDKAISYDMSKDNIIVLNVGVAFGNFQKNLKNFPIDELFETIEDFHNTKKRYQKFMEDLQNCPLKRVVKIEKEVEFIKERENICSLLVNAIKSKKIPLRVTHNDTKVNNVLLDKDTLEFKAVIDLDTVMPGSMLFDYGDGVRSIASNTLEDEKNLNKVSINLDLFASFTDGYMSEVAFFITKNELELMAESIRVITLELAIRFLYDYINNDIYFKTEYKEHNLDRARCQLALVKDIEEKMEDIKKYINISYQKYSK